MRNAPKGIASLFTLFFISCFISNAQVPQLETSGDYIDHIAVVENGNENNTAGYYRENKKYGFAYPKISVKRLFMISSNLDPTDLSYRKTTCLALQIIKEF